MQVPWIKTKVQAFSDILDATVESIPVNGENVELMQMFTFFGSVIHSYTNCKLEVDRRLGRAWSPMNLLDEVCGAADTSAKGQRAESFARWCSRSCCISVRPGL